MHHRVQWLSLNNCVQRFVYLLPEIVIYQEAHINVIQQSERAKMQDQHDHLVDRRFQLYLYFLQGHFPILSCYNTQLQKSKQDHFATY